MKNLFLTILLVSMTAPALALKNTCENKVRTHAFKMFKAECGGFGRKDVCEVSFTKNKTSGYLNAKVNCSYSGEPDYSAGLEVEYVVRISGCIIESEKVEVCDNW